MTLTLSKTLFLFLSLFLFLMMVANSQPDVTSFQIDSFRPSSDGLTYERDAFVPQGATYLRLIATNPSSGSPRSSSVGRVLYSSPIKFWERGRQASFETTIRLRCSSVDNNPADGMTFFIVPVNSTLTTGGNGQTLGIYDAVRSGARIFAVEFDVYVNDAYDPSFRHIGININSKTSSNVTKFEGALGQLVTARINYDAPTRRIDVVATYGSTISRVSYVYDLKSILTQQVQVGISASTGLYVANFDVTSFYFTSSMVADNNNFVGAYIEKYAT